MEKRYLIKYNTLYKPSMKWYQDGDVWIPIENQKIKTGINEKLTNVVLLTENAVKDEIVNGIANLHKQIIGSHEFDTILAIKTFITDFNSGQPVNVVWGGKAETIQKGGKFEGSDIKPGDILTLVPSHSATMNGIKPEELMIDTDGNFLIISDNNSKAVIIPHEDKYASKDYSMNDVVQLTEAFEPEDLIQVFLGGTKLIEDTDYERQGTMEIKFLRDIVGGALQIDVFKRFDVAGDTALLKDDLSKHELVLEGLLDTHKATLESNLSAHEATLEGALDTHSLTLKNDLNTIKTQAQTSATAANTSKTNASASEIAAKASEIAAKASETNAASAASTAASTAVTSTMQAGDDMTLIYDDGTTETFKAFVKV